MLPECRQLWYYCYELFKKAGNICGGFIDLYYNQADNGRVKVYVRGVGVGVGGRFSVYGSGEG